MKPILRISFWTAILCFVGIYSYQSFIEQEPIDIMLLFICSILGVCLINLPTIILYLNYFKVNRKTNLKLDLNTRMIFIESNKKMKQYSFDEVVSSIYNIGKYYQNKYDGGFQWYMPYSDFGYWDVEFKNGDRYYLSNLIIDFLHEEPFIEKTKFRFRRLALIDKRNNNPGKNFKDFREKTQLEKYLELYRSRNKVVVQNILDNPRSYNKIAIEAAKIVIKEKTLGNTVSHKKP